jgi:NAD(P)H-hydrate epimerase
MERNLLIIMHQSASSYKENMRHPVNAGLEVRPSVGFSGPVAQDRSDGAMSRGHAPISGGDPITGAARRAARATPRAGSKLTTTAVSEIALPIYAAALISIMVRPMVAPEDFDRLLAEHRISAFLIGPGAGVGKRLKPERSPAEPLCSMRMRLRPFRTIPGRLIGLIVGASVVTPHEGEFGSIER